MKTPLLILLMIPVCSTTPNTLQAKPFSGYTLTYAGAALVGGAAATKLALLITEKKKNKSADAASTQKSKRETMYMVASILGISVATVTTLIAAYLQLTARAASVANKQTLNAEIPVGDLSADAASGANAASATSIPVEQSNPLVDAPPAPEIVDHRPAPRSVLANADPKVVAPNKADHSPGTPESTSRQPNPAEQRLVDEDNQRDTGLVIDSPPTIVRNAGGLVADEETSMQHSPAATEELRPGSSIQTVFGLLNEADAATTSLDVRLTEQKALGTATVTTTNSNDVARMSSEESGELNLSGSEAPPAGGAGRGRFDSIVEPSNPLNEARTRTSSAPASPLRELAEYARKYKEEVIKKIKKVVRRDLIKTLQITDPQEKKEAKRKNKSEFSRLFIANDIDEAEGKTIVADVTKALTNEIKAIKEESAALQKTREAVENPTLIAMKIVSNSKAVTESGKEALLESYLKLVTEAHRERIRVLITDEIKRIESAQSKFTPAQRKLALIDAQTIPEEAQNNPEVLKKYLAEKHPDSETMQLAIELTFLRLKNQKPLNKHTRTFSSPARRSRAEVRSHL